MKAGPPLLGAFSRVLLARGCCAGFGFCRDVPVVVSGALSSTWMCHLLWLVCHTAPGLSGCIWVAPNELKPHQNLTTAPSVPFFPK